MTRSLTIVVDDNGLRRLTVVYRSGDGAPHDHGMDLRRICPTRLVDGLSGSDDGAANGMKCLAASVIAGLKHGIGGVYVYPPQTWNVTESYVYVLRPSPGYLASTPPTQSDESWHVMLDVHRGKPGDDDERAEESVDGTVFYPGRLMWSGKLADYSDEVADRIMEQMDVSS